MARRWSSVLSYAAQKYTTLVTWHVNVILKIEYNENHTTYNLILLPVPIPCLLYSIRMRSTEPTARLVAERNFPLGVITPTLPTSSGVFY